MSTYDQAIVRTGGKQYRVQPGMVLRVEKLDAEPGATVELTDVLLAGSGEDVKIGTPTLSGAKVVAKVRAQGRGRKVIVYKFRRRKNYRRRRGHRQPYTELAIERIEA
ncbi:MAG: 50S ribosomal protein L21 [Deltaproteobacteria bacterium]|nr:MAG: 50S ribosomal protein L21 [Deltaproteobacteria bacterium]